MNPEIKEKWIAALESGKYKKGNSYLKYEDSQGIFHCCLGVLCELHLETGEGNWGPGYVHSHEYITSPNPDEKRIKSISVLPSKVVKWSGISDCNGIFLVNGEKKFLSMINDHSLKKDFSEVIPFIKEYF